MANLATVKDEEVYRGLTIDQIDEINLKINHAIATLDILSSIDIGIELNIDSLTILAQEAHDKLIEVQKILDQGEENKKDN